MRASEVNFTPIKLLLEESGVSVVVHSMAYWHRKCVELGYQHVIQINTEDNRYSDTFAEDNSPLYELFENRELSNWTLYRGPRYYDIMLMFTNVEDAVYAKLML